MRSRRRAGCPTYWCRRRPRLPRDRGPEAPPRPVPQIAAKLRAPQSGLRATRPASSPSSDQLHLGLQLDAEAALHLGPRTLDKTRHVGSGRPSLIDYEVAMQLGDDRCAFTHTLQSGGLYEPPRRIAWRILEHAAAVLGFDRLRLGALLRQLGHQPLGLLPIATLEMDGGLDAERALQGALT